MRIADGVLWMAVRQPDKTAVRTGHLPLPGDAQAALTYGELAGQICAFGSLFRDLGGQPGDVVALHAENSLTGIALFLGLAHAGFVAAPLNPRLTRAETHAILSDMQPWVVVKQHEGKLFAGHTLDLAADDIPLCEQSSRRSSPSPNLDVRPTLPFPELDDGLSDTDPFYLGYSSGTTGQPKGLLRAHKSWTDSFLGMTLEFQLTSETTLLVPGPLYYSASLIAALHILFVGGTIEIARRFDAKHTAARLCASDCDITAVFMVPAMYRDVLEAAPSAGSDQPLTCVSCGDKFPLPLVGHWRERFRTARLFEYFGSSEVGFVCVHDLLDSRPGSVGRPFFSVCVRTLDEEIQVKSGLGFLGYAGAARSLEGDVRRPGGWLASGDLGHVDADGWLYLHGRASDLIICGGVNLYPAEIEQVVLAYPGIAEAAVVAAADERLGQVPVCAVVWRTENANDAAQIGLRAYLRQHLAGYKLPRWVVSLPALPRNSAGKVDKSALRSQF